PYDLMEAQSANKQFQFGIKGGINLSSFTEEHKELLNGSTFGVFADYYFIENIGIALGLNYSRKGGLMRAIVPAPPSYNPTADPISFDLYVRNNYVEIPVTLKYGFNLDNGISIIPFVGYSYSLALWDQENSEKKNKKQIQDAQIIKYTGQYSYDMVVINSFSSLIIGVRTEYNKFILDLGYSLALNSIGGASNIYNIDYKLQSITILIGYRFI
ncbi:MAG: PorT family protein, partial [Ignavibacterium sp.]|nr:PorT family protein [Ignavibacterium sp.]